MLHYEEIHDPTSRGNPSAGKSVPWKCEGLGREYRATIAAGRRLAIDLLNIGVI